MAILVSENERLFNLHTENTTYQFKADEHGFLVHTYYGSRIDEDDLYGQLCFADRGFSPNPYELGMTERTYSQDLLPQEYSAFGTGDFRISALKVRDTLGSRSAGLRYSGYEIIKGLYSIEGLPAAYSDRGEGETLKICLKDSANGLVVYLYYGVLEKNDVILRSSEMINEGENVLYLEKAASLNLDIPYGDHDMISFCGRHNMERGVCRKPIDHGISSFGSVRGTPSHQYNPFVIIAEPSATEEQGRCLGVSFVYSGEFLVEAEKDQTGATRLICGINPENFTWKLEKGECFKTPQTIMTYSEIGLTKLSHNLHNTINENIIRGKWKDKKCPVLINNWEATYFDFDGEKLETIAKAAGELGIDLFVLDDGWFGARNDDFRALGDWYTNEEKLGMSLNDLGKNIENTGMRFGLWVEPEAISEDSDLYREHPDWAIQVPGRKPALGRSQLNLDMSRKEVRDYINGRLHDILSSAPISYVKWDMNRSICDKYSASLEPDRQGELAHRYVLGLYSILESLVTDFPDILFEGCSGGGGRFDAGMLYYTPQIWCSDNTDAINRLRIQYGTSFCYPTRSMGAHVSASPNHQTGRKSSLKTRGVVAMAGTFGYELDVNKLDDEEKQEVSRQVKFLKNNERLLFKGSYYRLTTPDDKCCAWSFVSENRDEALVFAVYYDVEGNMLPAHFRVPGLDPDKKFRISETGWNGEEGEEQILSGRTLHNAGLTMPLPTEEGQAFIFKVESL